MILAATVTVPTIYVFVALMAPLVFLWVVGVRWIDRRFLDPWLRRRMGLPPKVTDADLSRTFRGRRDFRDDLTDRTAPTCGDDPSGPDTAPARN